jgi:DNA processing protein
MDMKTTLLALNRIEGMGPKRIQILQANLDHLASVFRYKPHQLEAWGLPSRIAHAISQFDFNLVEEDYTWATHPNNHLLTWDDDAYPPLLKEIDSPPPVIYAKGDLNSLNHPCIAIVGSRKPSIHGEEYAWKFAYELAGLNIVIASGLALGIDGQAHSGCMANQGKTIAVMATGIDRIYPARNRQLAKEIEKIGLIISEFPLKKPPQARHFPQRNRIISGLAISTLVVEAALKSGSLITARYALEQNRDVLAIPGSLKNPTSKGCHYLLQQGARLVTTVQDIIEELNLPTKPYQKNVKEPFIKLAKTQENLVKCLGFDVADVDTLCQRSGLSLDLVTCGLASLEVMGLVKSVPGGYIRC